MIEAYTHIVVTGTDKMLRQLAVQSRGFLKRFFGLFDSFFFRSGLLAFVVPEARSERIVCTETNMVYPVAMGS